MNEFDNRKRQCIENNSGKNYIDFTPDNVVNTLFYLNGLNKKEKAIIENAKRALNEKDFEFQKDCINMYSRCIHFIQNPTRELQMFLVNQRPSNILEIDRPLNDVQVAAVAKKYRNNFAD